MADEVTAPRPEGEEKVEDIQIMLSSDAIPDNLRNLKVFLFFFFFLIKKNHLLPLSPYLQYEIWLSNNSIVEMV